MSIEQDIDLCTRALRSLDNQTLAQLFHDGNWQGINDCHHRDGKRLIKIFRKNLELPENHKILDRSKRKAAEIAANLVSHHKLNVPYIQNLCAQDPRFKQRLQRLMLPWDLDGGGHSFSTFQANLRGALTSAMFVEALDFLTEASKTVAAMNQAVITARKDVADIWQNNCREISQNLSLMLSIPKGMIRSLLPAFVITPLAQLVNTWLSFGFDVSGPNWTEEGPNAGMSVKQFQELQAMAAQGRQDGQVSTNFGKGPQDGFFKGNHNPDGEFGEDAFKQWGAEGAVNWLNSQFTSATNTANASLNQKVSAWVKSRFIGWAPPPGTCADDPTMLLAVLNQTLDMFKAEIKAVQNRYNDRDWVCRVLLNVALNADHNREEDAARPARTGRYLADLLNAETINNPERFVPSLRRMKGLTEQTTKHLTLELTRYMLRATMNQHFHYYCAKKTEYSAQTTKSLDYQRTIGKSLRGDLLRLGIVTEKVAFKRPDRDKMGFHDFTQGALYWSNRYDHHTTKLVFKDWVWREAIEAAYTESITKLVSGEQNPVVVPPLVVDVSPQTQAPQTMQPPGVMPPQARTGWA